MKFLIDARTFASEPSGVGMYAYRRTLELMDENPGAEFMLVCDVNTSAEIAELLSHGAEVRVYGRRVYNSTAVIGYLRFAGRVAAEIRPDIFWQPNNLQPFRVRGARKTVVTLHDTFPLEEFSLKNVLWHIYWHWAFARTIANVDQIEYNSAVTKRAVEARSVRARQLAGRVRHPIALVPERKMVKPYQYGRDFFLYVGNLETRKGADILFAAYRRYREQGGKFDLLLAGKARNVAVPEVEGIAYLGYVNEETKFSLMASAAALVVPSRQEGYGMQVAEAAKLGVKLILADLPVFAEIEGKDCIFVHPGDVQSLMSALLDFQV